LDYLKGFNFFERYVHGQWEGDLYTQTHSRRFYETLRLLPDLPAGARVLEVGALPYYLTILLKKFRGLNVETLSLFEFEESETTTHTVENVEFGEVYDFQYGAVNVERDAFPYDDNSFDAVLCCEVLEHLLINPSHMLYEIHRVLRPGGHLLLTTPNVATWGNVFALIKGNNIYDRYHGNGIYGRHNREYSMTEVRELLEKSGFSINSLYTRSVYGPAWMNSVPWLLNNRRDNIFALARSDSAPRAVFPPELYVLMEEYRNVVRPVIEMGENEIGQIGRGWYDLEMSTPPFRWTTGEAEFFLKRTDQKKLGLRVRTDNPKLRTQPLDVSLEVNGRVVAKQSLTVLDWHDLYYDISSAGDEDVLRCKLSLSATWVPQNEPGSSDSRRLGVCVSRIWLE
jgi:SAM-dependent methyltransferase